MTGEITKFLSLMVKIHLASVFLREVRDTGNNNGRLERTQEKRIKETHEKKTILNEKEEGI